MPRVKFDETLVSICIYLRVLILDIVMRAIHTMTGELKMRPVFSKNYFRQVYLDSSK